MTDQKKLQSNPLLKAIYDNLPAQVGLTEGIEVAERILAAIQKVNNTKEFKSAEDILDMVIGIKTSMDERKRLTIQAMEEYALQYQSVPVSEWTKCEIGMDMPKEDVLCMDDQGDIFYGSLYITGLLQSFQCETIRTFADNITHYTSIKLPIKND